MADISQLNNKWLRSSVLGCLWASSEIVLGSFLHNLRIPFSGTILTGIGIVILVSVSYLWKERGLFWRSALVCSLMKSVSPSAFIFGPMIAIFAEGILMEMAVRIAGKNIAAYLLGGMLAMSWTLFQKMANLIIIYGFNIVTLYENLAAFAGKQLNLETGNIWLPVIILWMVYVAGGILASAAGIYIGRKAVRHPYIPEGIATGRVKEIQSSTKPATFGYSLGWLLFDITGMITVLFLMNYSRPVWWLLAGTLILVVWGFRYQRALRPLKKPGFWILFILITMLTSFLFTEMRHSPDGLKEGIMTGIQMNFRAAVMVVGFSAIGTELLNPVIGNFFRKTAFRQLLLALEVAFETLPFVIARLPGMKNIFRKPVSILHQLVSQADFWHEKLRLKYRDKPMVILLTGGTGHGKSVMLEAIVAFLKADNITTGGILSVSSMENDLRNGYDIVDAATGERRILARITGDEEMIRVGRFYFRNDGLEFGRDALLPEKNKEAQVIVADEIGPWELENQGWAPSITRLLLESSVPMIWCVRESIVDKVIENWELTNYKTFNVTQSSLTEIAAYIRKHISPPLAAPDASG